MNDFTILFKKKKDVHFIIFISFYLGIEPEPFTLGEHLIQTSSKLFLLDLLLQFLYNPNYSNLGKSFYSSNSKPVHKVLIFSQMTRMLDIIQDYMTLRGMFLLFVNDHSSLLT